MYGDHDGLRLERSRVVVYVGEVETESISSQTEISVISSGCHFVDLIIKPISIDLVDFDIKHVILELITRLQYTSGSSARGNTR